MRSLNMLCHIFQMIFDKVVSHLVSVRRSIFNSCLLRTYFSFCFCVTFCSQLQAS